MDLSNLRPSPPAAPDPAAAPSIDVGAQVPGMATLPRRLAARLRPALPSVRDLHVYGGGVLVALGAWMAWPPAAPAVLGLLLLYLGLRRR